MFPAGDIALNPRDALEMRSMLLKNPIYIKRRQLECYHNGENYTMSEWLTASRYCCDISEPNPAGRKC